MIERSSDAELAETLRLLGECIDRAVRVEGEAVTFGPLRAYRVSEPTAPEDGVLSPVICAVAQGVKEVALGQNRYVYGAGHFIVNSTPVPATGRTIEATPDKPCLWVSILIDPAIVQSVLEDSEAKPTGASLPLRCVEASVMDLPLARALLKMAWLLDAPGDEDYLSALAMREIVYRLLSGSQADRVRQIASHSGEDAPVANAITWVRQNFNKTLSVETLARRFGMSPSMLHLRFKEVTAMSPLQFQKQLRLQEAKRLITGSGLNAADAATQVGYDSPSHFNRDYRRFFGDSPRRHAARLLDAAKNDEPYRRTPAPRTSAPESSILSEMSELAAAK